MTRAWIPVLLPWLLTSCAGPASVAPTPRPLAKAPAPAAAKVDEVKLSAGARPDSRGIVRWNLTLKPKEKRELRIAYQVEYPSELILETRRRQAAQPAPPAASPYAPSPARRKVEEQLMDLESQF